MIATTLGEIAGAVGGRLADGADSTQDITDVTSDSRSTQPGSLFVALKGTRVDGHDFADIAVRNGATAVLATRPIGVPAIVVDDVLQALGQLARFHLDRLLDITVIAVTGSVGKTTTKDLVAQLLSASGPTVAPPGSFNNELGLPLTVLSADGDTRYLVLEMGARAEGHISYLCRVAPPMIGVELMVGAAHIGEFGSHESIVRAKGELVAALPPAGVAVLNADDDDVMSMAGRTSARVITFGTAPTAEVRAENVVVDSRDRAKFDLVTPEGRAPVTMRLSGAHLVPNALAAAAVAHRVGQRTPEIAAALSHATLRSRWRMEVIETPDGVTIVNDAYNASPESMRAALQSLNQMATGRRAWAVLGEMRELGNESAREHDAVGRLVARLDVQHLVVVGNGARPMLSGAQLESSGRTEAIFVPDVEAAAELLNRQLESGDVVLVKASRAVGLERLVEELVQTRSETGEAT